MRFSDLAASYRGSLRLKILLPTYLTLAGLVLALSFFAHRLVERNLLDTELRHCMAEARFLARDEHMVEAIAQRDPVAIARECAAHMPPTSFVAIATYLRDGGQQPLRLQHAQSSLGPAHFDFPGLLRTFDAGGEGSATLLPDRADWVLVTVPVRAVINSRGHEVTDLNGSKDLGALQILQARSYSNAASSPHRFTLTALSLVLLLMGTVAINRVVDGILGPIVALEAGLQRLTDGHLDHRIGVEDEDEVGRLAGMFNEMATNLAESRQQVQDNAHMLESRVAERTGELQRAMDELQSLDQARESFLSSVSHELRTPLTSILAGVEILRDFALDDPAAREEFLAIIHKEAERMLNLVGDILDYAKVAAQSLRLEFATHDVSALLGQVVDQLAQRLAQSGVVLTERRDSSHILCMCDGTRIKQVFRNLLDNALKFSPRGGTVWVEQGIDTRDWWFRIRDEGPGVPVAIRSQIFQGFEPGGGATRQIQSGLGFGLPLSMHIVQAHGGHLELEPTASGASFLVRVPLQPQQACYLPARTLEITGVEVTAKVP